MVLHAREQIIQSFGQCDTLVTFKLEQVLWNIVAVATLESLDSDANTASSVEQCVSYSMVQSLSRLSSVLYLYASVFSLVFSSAEVMFHFISIRC